jgi:hypothetical protein
MPDLCSLAGCNLGSSCVGNSFFRNVVTDIPLEYRKFLNGLVPPEYPLSLDLTPLSKLLNKIDLP